MAAFCRYWRMTPKEYRALTVLDFEAMARYMIEDNERQNGG